MKNSRELWRKKLVITSFCKNESKGDRVAGQREKAGAGERCPIEPGNENFLACR